MQAYIRAELLKVKRTFAKKLIWLAPLLTLLLCAALMAGPFLQSASYNWWYAMLLPGALTLMCAGLVQKDVRKLKYRALLGLPIHLGRVWLGKISAGSLMLLASTIVLFTGITLSGFVFSGNINLQESAVASLLLFLTFLWQIPLCLFLVDRIGMFAALIINVLGNVACMILFSETSLWWAVPYAIPARLMCAVIGVLPNGLPVPVNDALLDRGVIVPGVLITLALFILLSALTMLPFRNREAK